MKPRPVLVETNWVVDVVVPAHLQNPQAVQLLVQANAGELELHVPAVCLTEAGETIPRRFTPRSRSDDFRKFVKWARDAKQVTDAEAMTAFGIFDQFDRLVADELKQVPERLDALANHPGLNIFPLTERMLARQVSLSTSALALKPYDLAILAAVLVKGEGLSQAGYDVLFCELDSDLQPWDKFGVPKPILSNFYHNAGILVQGNFLINRLPI